MSLGEITGWGRWPRVRADLRTVDSWSAIRGLTGPRIGRGAARSYGDASFLAGGTVLDLQPRNRFLSFDRTQGLLRAEAGVTLREVLELGVPSGWFLPVTPGTKFPTLGGSVAADVHGKNHHVDGDISTFVEELTLVLAGGSETVCSPKQDPELFWATCGGMGLTGIIKDVTLRLRKIETSSIRVRHDRCRDLDAVMALLTENAADFLYSVAWIDCLAQGADLGRSVVIRGDHAKLSDLPPEQRGDPLKIHRPPKLRVPIDFPGFALNPLTVRAFNAVYYRAQKEGERLVHYDPFFYPLDAVHDWSRCYGRRGFLQYQCVLPHRTSREGLVYLLESFSRTGNASFLAVLKTMGAEAGPLGFPLPGFTLALDIPMIGASLLALLDQLDERVAALGGRLYFAKDSRMNARWMATMYPRLGEWLAVKRRVDPENLFASDLSRRLNLHV